MPNVERRIEIRKAEIARQELLSDRLEKAIDAISTLTLSGIDSDCIDGIWIGWKSLTAHSKITAAKITALQHKLAELEATQEALNNLKK